MGKITKAVIPVAGFGTRFLPITKSVPKEMLPIVDRPIIQIIVEELAEAGIKDIIFVSNPYKRAIEDYFQPHFELETLLRENDKKTELAEIHRLSNLANFVFTRQKKMRGTGDAILTAEAAIGEAPFFVSWGDDFIVAKPSRAKQLVEAFARYQAPILGTIETKNPQDGRRYGFATGEEVGQRVIKVEKLIEKPGVGQAPSEMAVVSSFILTPEIFPALRQAQKEIGSRRELNYIDGLNILKKHQSIYALKLRQARLFSAGDKLEYLKTVVEFGLKHPQLGKEFKEYLRKLTGEL